MRLEYESCYVNAASYDFHYEDREKWWGPDTHSAETYNIWASSTLILQDAALRFSLLLFCLPLTLIENAGPARSFLRSI